MLLGIAALGTIYYGTELYYPYGYVGIAQPYCSGVSEEGCSLTWRDVPTEDGGSVPQCVQYCRQGVEPVAVSAAQAQPAPTGNEGGCELQGFADPELQGQSFTTSDNYPTMDEWKQQVASIQVNSGTWDLFSEDNYGGDAIRLTPGSYRTLGDSWTYGISSFMCTQPGGGEGGGTGGSTGAGGPGYGGGGGQGGGGGGPGGPGGPGGGGGGQMQR